MKCYYEELAIERDANESEIKTAYRKLALKWHPDKNLDASEEAKERFQLIQQAYEVLSDPQERAWYDNHREQILRGKNSDYEDSCLDVFQYFTVSCFKGYADDAKGFYSIYREVFEKIAAEDAEFIDDEEELENIPKFGDSKSSYEDVVGPFYAYWSAYCTKRTYTWLCPYNIQEIKDRRILREIEKDMKKVVQKAKKERNEEVRNLVSFIRKRDKRVLAYKKVLEERAAFNRQKQEQNRIEQIRRRQQELEEMRQNNKTANPHNDDYEEQLKQLEQEYSSDEEYYDDEEDDEDDENNDIEPSEDVEDNEDEDYLDDLYCVACNKEFKTDKAFANHETSKKHRDNVEKLKLEMQQEEESHQQEEHLEEEQEICLTGDEMADTNIDVVSETEEEQIVPVKTKSRKSKNKKEAKKSKLPVALSSEEDIKSTDEEEGEINIVKPISKLDIVDNDDEEDDDWNSKNKKSNKKSKNKGKSTKTKTNPSDFQPSKSEEPKQQQPKTTTKPVSIPQSCDLEYETTQHLCVTCKSKFESKNKLFSHLKLTNHGVYIPKGKDTNDDNGKTKKSKGKKK